MSIPTQEKYQKVIQKCKKVFVEKNKDYDTAWRILRLPSFTDQIMIKARRIRTIQEKKQQIEDNVSTELVGIVNYAILALMQIRLSDNPTPNISHAEISAHYEQITEENSILLEHKNHDYGEAWRTMRFSSIIDIILMKLLRIKKIEDNQGYTMASEGIESGYRDIMNYAVFALIQLGFPA